MSRRGKRRRGSDKNNGSGPGWLASYADTMTLLLTFFVLLYSMAEVDSQKISALSNAFQKVLQGQKGESILDHTMSDGNTPLVGGESEVDMDATSKKSELEYTYEELNRYIEEQNLSNSVVLNKTEKGVQLQLGENLLFESGESKLHDDSKNILNKVAEIMGNTSGNIEVEGHTDNVPLDKNGKTNWELSVERAVSVIRFFIEEKEISANRLSAVGYSEHKPIADNSTNEGKAANRRVSILFSSKEES